MPLFSEQAWQKTAPLRAAIDALPFNVELASGALSRDRFQTYIIQDALYLDQYGRTLALAGARGPDGATLKQFAESALGAIVVEQALHETYLRDFGVDPTMLARSEPSPDCLGYTSYLMATAYHDPFEVLLAALLPCFWIYWDVGNTIAKRTVTNNPYKAWIDTYSDDHFGDAVKAVIAATDRAAAATTQAIRDRMMNAFVLSTRWEWLFWDSAYQKRTWPLGG